MRFEGPVEDRSRDKKYPSDVIDRIEESMLKTALVKITGDPRCLDSWASGF
jgi:hypothetical protein